MLLKNKIPFRYVFGQIKYELLLVTLYGISIELLEFGYKSFTKHEFSIPIAVPTVLGTIISLLLAFRSNLSYDRWWEARQVWGAIVNDSRTLTRQLNSMLNSGEEETEPDEFRKKIIRRQIAWNFALAKSLRNGIPLPYIEKFLEPEEFEYVARFNNVPMALLDLHGRDLKKALQKKWINNFQQVELDQTLTRLCDAMGKCERIKKTVFPSTYGLYIHFALWVFTLLLPFALVDLFGFIMVPILVVLTSCFFLIEKMAIHLQDPFENKPTDIPVLSISRTIERDLKQLMEEKDIPVEFEQKEFYIM